MNKYLKKKKKSQVRCDPACSAHDFAGLSDRIKHHKVQSDIKLFTHINTFTVFNFF